MTSVKFGLLDENEFNTNSATINTFYPINYHEYLATTRSGLYKFDNDIIKKVYPYKLATSIIIPEYKFIVGISSLGGEIIVMLVDDLDNPIFSHFKTDQLNIFHVIYSKKSHSLITVGSGIKVWNFDVRMPRKVTLINKPEITITLRSQIAPNYNTPILNPPSIDRDQELLYLPTPNGFCGFDLDGKEKKLFSKIDSTAQTAASLCSENKKFISSLQGDGFHLWNSKGYLVKKIPGVMSSILAIRFVNRHFALFLDSNFWIFIIDVKTNNFYHCYTIKSKPNYFNVYRDAHSGKYYLIVSQGCSVKKLEIVLPWTVWKKMTTQPCSIRRCPKFKEAARILTFYKSSIFSFLSPKDGKELTSAVDTQPSGPIFHYYDRGLFLEPVFDESNNFVSHTNIIEIFPENKRDVLFVTTAESNTSLFSTGNNPCNLIKIIEIQVSSITVCEINDAFMYCFSNSQGELLFYNYSDFSRYNRKLILKKPINRIFYHRKSGSIIIVFQDEIHLFDLNSFKDVQKIDIKDGSYSEFYGNLLLIGCKNGNIDSFRIDFLNGCYCLSQMTDICIHYHDDEVTSFAFSPTFFVSSSLDKTVKIWNYNFNLLFDIIFPFPLFSVEILNAQRDILVGTDNEILKIKGSSLFGFSSSDEEIAEIDNYDRISDELTNQLIQFATEKNKEEKSDFLSCRNKGKNDDEIQQKVAKIKNFHSTITNDNFDSQIENKQKQNQNNTELSEEERNRRLYEMNLINERSDNEKLQARIRAEMKMKKDEEERKKKLREAEEEAKRRAKLKEEEEEEEKNETTKGRKRRKRKVRRQKDQLNDDNQQSSEKNDDFDDFLFKPKKKEEGETNDQNRFQRPKAVYKPRQSAPRPSYRPKANQSQNKDNDDENNYDDYGYDYEEEEYDEMNKDGSEKVGSKSETKMNKRKIKRGTKNNQKSNNQDANETTSKKKNNKKKNNQKSRKNKNDGCENSANNKTRNKSNGDEEADYEEEEEMLSESQIENNDSDGNKSANNKSNKNDNNSNSLSNKVGKAEKDTQTMFQYEEKSKNDETESNKKKKETATKRKNQQVKSQEGVSNEKDQNGDQTKMNKKRSENMSKSNKLKSNSALENKDSKEKKSNKENKDTKNEKESNDTNNIKNDKKMKRNALRSKQKRKQEQIFLSERFKRIPTPPPDKKVYYSRNPINGSNINSKTLDPNKPLLLFRARYPLRRCRTPPVLDQEKLLLLPGPEIVLDREAIIEKILDGNVELMPLLKRLNSDNRSYFIQKLKQSYFKNRETRNNQQPQSQPLQRPQIHNVQFGFENQINSFYNQNAVNENNFISLQLSYPPYQQQQQQQLFSRQHPLLPNIQNLNTNKLKQTENASFKNEEQNHVQETDNFSKEKQQKQQRVSILNLGFEPQLPVPPLNFAHKREITLPNVQRLKKNSFLSPRRNQIRYQRRIQNDKEGFSKSSDNFSKAKIGPLPPYEKAGEKHKNNNQKPLFLGMRNSSPSAL